MRSRRWFQGKFSLIPMAWLTADFKLRSLRVASALASHADTQSGLCRVSLKTIAAETADHISHVRDAVRQLESLGYVERIYHSGRASEYRMLDPTPIQSGVTPHRIGLDPSTPNRSRGAHQFGLGSPHRIGLPHYVELTKELITQQTEPMSEKTILWNRLVEIGVSKPKATELVALNSEDRVRVALDEVKGRQDIASPAGYLVRILGGASRGRSAIDGPRKIGKIVPVDARRVAS